MDDQAFAAAAGTLGSPLSRDQLDRFRLYEDRLKSWSGRVSLVSKADRGRLREHHFLDALAAVPYLPEGPFRLLDLGSGAGLPGIPIKIVRPDIRVDLLEPARMKVLFLQSVRDELGLCGLEVVRARAEELASLDDHRGRYRWITSRGVGPLPLLQRLATPLLQAEGALVAFKGPGALREFGDAAPAGVSATERIVRIPPSGRRRALVFLAFGDSAG